MSSGAVFIGNYTEESLKTTRIQVLTTPISSIALQYGHLVIVDVEDMVRTWKLTAVLGKLVDKVDLTDYVSQISELTKDEKLAIKKSYSDSHGKRKS